MSTNYPTSLDSYATLVDNVDDALAAHQNNRGDAIEALEAKLGVNSSAVNTSIDYFLKHASGNFRTHTHTGGTDDGALMPINNISEIDISSLTDNQFLRYNSSSAKWENETFAITLNELSNVNTTGVATRMGIYYNGSSWEDGYPNAVYSA